MADKKYNLRPNTRFRLDHESCATCGVDEELNLEGITTEFSISPQSKSATVQQSDIGSQSGVRSNSHEDTDLEQNDPTPEIKYRKGRESQPIRPTQIISKPTDYEDISQISAPVKSSANFVPSDTMSIVKEPEKTSEHVHLSRSMGPMTEPSGISSGNTSAIYNSRPAQCASNTERNTRNEANFNRATHIEGPNVVTPPQYFTAWGDAIQYEGEPLNQRNYLRPRPNYGQGDFTAPKVNLPTFNGKTDWEAFWVQFEFFCQRYNWDQTEKMSQLMSSLRDIAMQYVARLPVIHRSSYDQLVDALKLRFGDHVLPETHRATLQTIRKNAKEELHEFASRVCDQVSKAYPGLVGSQLHTDLTIETIVNGLQDPSLVYDVLTKKPKSVREAVDMIAWHDCCKGTSRKRSGIRQVADTEEYDVRRVNDKKFVTEERLNSFGRGLQESLIESMKELFEKQGNKNAKFAPRNNHAKPTLLCFKCNSPNHLMAKCPQYTKGPQKAQSQGMDMGRPAPTNQSHPQLN